MNNKTITESMATPEFSRPIPADSIKIGKSDHKIDATHDECSDLAKRFGLLDLNFLRAHLKLNRKGQGDSLRIYVSGHLSAKLSQPCVITLEPVISEIETDFVVILDTITETLKIESEIDSGNDDIIDPIIDATVDFGELIAQNLAIEIDPFPKLRDVDGPGLTLETAETRENPFAVLKNLKTK